ncbi:hypothetical protein bcgnr5372_27060 [Bacillus luti]|nr:hypothetical protein [Bacillus cereus]HDR8331309.1 hypothetical protein [Bacillus cereus]HDR8336576.1 hypothetical protein [Bacillus cereus]
MLDIDWILSITSDEYLKKTAKFTNFSLPGFVEGWNAPPSLLRTHIKSGLKGAKRKSNPVLNIKILLNVILNETFKELKITDDTELTLENFYLIVEMNPTIQHIQVIAFYYTQFETECKKNINTLRKNIEEGKPILSGISTIESVNPLEKINTFMHNSLTPKEVTSFLNSLEKSILKNTRKKNYEQLQEELAKLEENTEDENEENASYKKENMLNFIFSKIAATPKVDRPVVILAFLKHNNNFAKAEYHFLTQYLYTYTVKLREKNAKTIKTTTEKQLLELQVQFDDVVQRMENLTLERKSTEESIEKSRIAYEKLEQKVEEQLQEISLQEEIIADENNQKNQNSQLHQAAISPLLAVFTRIIDDNPLLLITTDIERFTHTPFQEHCISIDEFHFDLLNSDATAYEDYKLFIERAYFTSSIEWLEFRNLLEKHALHYTELSGYDLSDWLLQLINAINKEAIYYGNHTNI